MNLDTGTEVFIYCCVNIIFVYIKHCFLRSFFKELKRGCQRKYRSVLLLYYIVAMVSFLIINNENLNMVIGFSFTFILTLCYESKMYNRLIAVLFITILSVGCEIITLFIFKLLVGGKVNLPNNGVEMLFMVIVSKLMQLLAVRMLSPIFRLIHNERNITFAGKGFPLFFTYWLSVLMIPAASIFVMHTIYKMAMSLQNAVQMRMLTSVLLILLINALVFYLYDKLIIAYDVEMENVLLNQQVKYHIEQYRQIKKDEEVIFELKHDLKNQMLGVLSCLQSENPGKIYETREIIMGIIGKIGSVGRTVSTGIEVFDSIINYKAAVAFDFDVKLEVKSDLRQDYPIDTKAICIILGNAIDNAIDACCELASNKEKIITIHILEVKRNLYLRVENPCSKALELKNGLPVTTKKEKALHGIGLKSIDKAVRDYGGSMVFGTEDGVFTLELILYNKNPL